MIMQQTVQRPYPLFSVVNDRASLLTAALEFVAVLIFLFSACGWFAVTGEGGENSHEECVCV